MIIMIETNKKYCHSTQFYNRMRVMLLGHEQSGKTSLLQLLKRESLQNNSSQVQQQPIQRKVGGFRHENETNIDQNDF